MSSTVLQETINKVTDPDYVNQIVLKMLDPETDFYQLEVKVMESKGFVEYGTTALDAPYIALEIDSQQTRTRKGEPPERPAWNQSFFFILPKSKVDHGTLDLRVQLCDFNLIGKDDVIGELEMKVSAIPKQERDREWLLLSKPTGEGVAEILLEFFLIPVKLTTCFIFPFFS